MFPDIETTDKDTFAYISYTPMHSPITKPHTHRYTYSNTDYSMPLYTQINIYNNSQTVSNTTQQCLTKNTVDDKVILAVLNEINKIRIEHKLPIARLINISTSIAQFRAKDMILKNYYGHCDLEGMIPNYWYTKLGGAYTIEENIGDIQICIGSESPTLPASINNSDIMRYAIGIVRDMIYNDADSNWGHRDSLLDPTNNFIDIGYHCIEGRFVLVIHMSKIWVRWIESPFYDNMTNVFRAYGILEINNSKIESIVIYKLSIDKLNNIFATYTLKNNRCININITCTEYSIGKAVAGVVPNSYYYYTDMETIIAKKWIVNNNGFYIEFSWRPKSPGLYTIVIWAKNTLGIEHPYDPDRYRAMLPILQYTFVWST